jgi:acyl dehydratase
MPVPTSMVGDSVGPMVHEVDARWTMAYSAALGDTHDCYFDTRRPEGVVAHPLFAVCPEWPVIVHGREIADRWGITPDESRQSVHATHDLTVHRLVRPGDVLSTTLTYVGVEQKRPGAYATTLLETVDADGNPVASTLQGGMYLGVPSEGADVPGPAKVSPFEMGPPPESVLHTGEIPVAHGAAHTYTECARIWNPIHTDAAVAEAAGLPAIILHGTATLALGVSFVVDQLADGNPERVRRIVGRFASMVLMPSTLTVRVFDAEPMDDQIRVRFEVRGVDGGAPVDRGVVMLDPS